jgi:hypothetical protein
MEHGSAGRAKRCRTQTRSTGAKGLRKSAIVAAGLLTLTIGGACVSEPGETNPLSSAREQALAATSSSANCPGTFTYHFFGYGGTQQSFNTFHGFSQDTHHIGTVANDLECLGYGIGSINAIYDQDDLVVNGEYRLCCNNNCAPSISRVSFTLDDASCGGCPGTFVYHFSGYGGTQQYDVTFRGLSGDSHHIGTIANDAECLGYGIGSINAVYDQDDHLVNGEHRLCCNNNCGPSITRVSFRPDDPKCVQ